MTFDLVAPVYDFLARVAFGRSLIRAQQWIISQVRSGSRVLVLGGGTGATLPDLLACQPDHVLYVEASAVMLEKARQRTPSSAPITFRKGTEKDLTVTDRFDFIVLPFVLDVYPLATLQASMVPTLLRHLAQDGQLLVTDFDRPKTYWHRVYMWLMLRFFTITADIPAHKWTDWPRALRQAGLVEEETRLFRSGQVYSGCWVRG